MTTLLPIIDQMQAAPDDRERARVLLSCPDLILAKYADVFEAACRRAGFEAGAMLVQLRVDALRAVRDEAGLLPARIAGPLDELRTALARFAAGPERLASPDPPPCPTDL